MGNRHKIVASAIVILLGGAYFLWLGQWFKDLSASPASPTGDERIVLLVDEVAVPLEITANFREGRSSQNDEVGLRISLDPSYGSPVTAHIFLQGDAFGQNVSGSDVKIGDCPIAFVVEPPNTGCETVNFDSYLPGLTVGEAHMLTVSLSPTETIRTIYMKLDDAQWSESAGKRTYFALPKVGTADTHPTVTSTALNYPNVGDLYVPTPFTAVVDYRELGARERVETVSPALPLDDSLAWVTNYYGLVAPKGVLTDVDKEEKQTNEFAIVGFLAGLGIPMMGLLQTSMVAAHESLFSGRRQRRNEAKEQTQR